jgi:hypothetical protein
MILDGWTSQSRGAALCPATHREQRGIHLTLLIASFFRILAGCGESKEAFNEWNGNKSRLDEQGNLVVQSSAVEGSDFFYSISGRQCSSKGAYQGPLHDFP